MIEVKVKCIHCGKSLMDEGFEIDDHPSIKVIIEYKGKQGILRLSSLYGSYNIDSEIDVPKGEIARFFCPHCRSDMTRGRMCDECGAPMVTFECASGGYLRICSRRGCKKHLVEFEDLETEIKAFYDAYSTFFRGG